MGSFGRFCSVVSSDYLDGINRYRADNAPMSDYLSFIGVCTVLEHLVMLEASSQC